MYKEHVIAIMILCACACRPRVVSSRVHREDAEAGTGRDEHDWTESVHDAVRHGEDGQRQPVDAARRGDGQRHGHAVGRGAARAQPGSQLSFHAVLEQLLHHM